MNLIQKSGCNARGRVLHLKILSTVSAPATANATLLMVKGKNMRKERLCVTIFLRAMPSKERRV